MSDFSALNTAYTGIHAAQRALQTISHNVANVGTDGYTRQRVETGARGAVGTPDGSVGTGVDVTTLSRQRDRFLDDRVRTESASLAYQDVRATRLLRTEALVGDIDGALTTDLADLFAAFEDVALDPSSSGTREVAVSQLDVIATRLRTLSAGISDIAASTRTDVERGVAEVNATLQDLAAVDRAIAEASASGHAPNDLLDRRDILVDDVTARLGARATVDDDGRVRVSLNGLALVSAGRATALSVDTSGTVTHPHGSVTPGGELGGLTRFLSQDAPQLQGQLDALAVRLRDDLNAANAGGFTASGAAGGPLLTGTGAADLVAATSPAAIAAAAGTPASSFDGRNAEVLAGLRQAPGPTGTSLSDQARDIVVGLGAKVSQAVTQVDRQASVAAAAASSRDSAHGVDIDEEMVHLMSQQRALEAASRVLTTVDEALDVLINRTGVVGR